MTIQKILRARQRDAFVGRDKFLDAFRSNLARSSGSSDRRFVFAVSGDAGIGKTFLLRRLRQIAETSGCLAAWTDENDFDGPTILAKVAQQLSVEADFADFEARYKTYRIKKDELAADPEAPQGLSTILARAVTRGGLRLAQEIPVASIVADLVDEEAVTSFLGDAGNFLFRKLKSTDDLRLVVSPTEVLTPLFLKHLNQLACKKPVALFFDTFEKTSEILDPWLRALLEGQYGEVSSEVLFVVAGQNELDRNSWAPYEGLLARWHVILFSEEETREYLVRKGVTDERTIRLIWDLSGGLPLLVATLAAEQPTKEFTAGGSSDTAVKRFLKWVDREDRRQLALAASVPREFNRDLLQAIDTSITPELLNWLIEMPFVERTDAGFRYHSVIRTHILRLLRADSPDRLASLHKAACQFYQPTAANRRNVSEWIYHSLAENPTSNLWRCVDAVFKGLLTNPASAQNLANSLSEAAQDTGDSEALEVAQRLSKAVTAFLGGALDEAFLLFEEFVDNDRLAVGLRARLMNALGWLSDAAHRESNAAEAFQAAAQLDPTLTIAWMGLSEAKLHLRDYVGALSACERAIATSKPKASSIFLRARIKAKRGETDDAIADFRLAVSMDSDYAHGCYKHIGTVYSELGDYAKAVQSFRDSLSSYPECPECWDLLAEALAHQCPLEEIGKQMRVMLDMIGQGDRPQVSGALAASLFRYSPQEAIEGLNKAVEADPKDDYLLGARGRALYSLRRYSESLADFNAAVDATPNETWILRGRLRVRVALGDYQGAIEDAEAVVSRQPESHTDLSTLGDICIEGHQPLKALSAFRRALKAEPHCPHCWSGVVQSCIAQGVTERVSDAVRSFIGIDLTTPDTQCCLGLGLINAGLEREGVEVIENCLTLNSPPTDYLERAEAWNRVCEYERALRDIETANARSGFILSPDNLVRKGLLLARSHRFAESLAIFRSLPPSLPIAYNIAVAMIFESGKQPASAEIADLEGWIRKAVADGDSFLATYAEAGLAALRDDRDRAMHLLHRSLMISPMEVREFLRNDMAWEPYYLDDKFRSIIEQYVDLSALPFRKLLGRIT